MFERIRSLLQRFPEIEEAVKGLLATDAAFDFLCQEYCDLSRELRRLAQENRPSPGKEATGLRMRHTAVEEVLLQKIEGYESV